MGGGDHSSPAEGVADEQPHLASGFAHELHGADGVFDLVRKRAIAPVALRVPESEVVEPQHPDAFSGELLADSARCRRVLAEGETVCEDAPSANFAFG